MSNPKYSNYNLISITSANRALKNALNSRFKVKVQDRDYHLIKAFKALVNSGDVHACYRRLAMTRDPHVFFSVSRTRSEEELVRMIFRNISKKWKVAAPVVEETNEVLEIVNI